MNIPVYRAKSNERKNIYVEGFLIGVDKDIGLCTIRTKDDYIGGEICYLDTLSIHLPDMIDSQGKETFASLDRYYLKGADILENDSFLGDYSIQVAIYSEGCFYAQDKDGDMYNLCENWEKLKVIGIQE